MKKYSNFIVFIVLLCQLSITCTPQNTLSENDKKIITEVGFDSKLLSNLRTLTDSAFRIEKGYSSISDFHASGFKDSLNYIDFLKKDLIGLSLNENNVTALAIVEKLKEQCKEKGYFIYISEQHFGYTPEEITILKTKDKFDLLRFECTNGVNHNLFVDDIIQKITEWDKLYSIDFIGVGSDFISGTYKIMPKDLKKHSKELYDFCPDIVDQGTGSVESLEDELKKTNHLYLWWD